MLTLRSLPGAFRVPGFGLLWVSLASIGLGTAISQVALTWTMLALTGSPFMVGAALSARLAPFLVFGLPLGALSDRVDRRRLIIWANVAGAALSGAIAALAFAGEVGITAILVLSFALGSIDTARMTATQAYVYDLVGSGSATSGIALSNLGSQLAASAGAVVGGVVIAQLTFGAAFILTAAAGLAAAVVLLLATPPERTELIVPETNPRQALTLLVRDRTVAAIALLIVLTEIFGFSTSALVPTFAKDILLVDAAGLGVLVGARSIGGMLGLGWLATRGARRGGGRLFLATTGAFGIVLVAFALSGSFFLSLGLMLGVGVAAAALDSLGQTILQRTTPDHERGAAMGVWVFSIGFGPIGLLLLGAAAAAVGAPETQLVSGGILVLVAALLAVRTGLRRLP